MSEILISYFCFGAGMYIGMALNNPLSFLKAPTSGLVRGFILCFVFWPIGLIAKLIMILTKESP